MLLENQRDFMNQFNDKEFQIIKLLTKGLNNTEISKKYSSAFTR